MEAPIDRTKVILSGITFYFKYSLASMRFAAKHHISGDRPAMNMIESEVTNPIDPEGPKIKIFLPATFEDQAKNYEYLANQAAVCAHIQDDIGLLHADINPDRMASMIGPGDFEAIGEAVREAMEKAMPAASKAQTSPAGAPV